jgi:hypothetical protein
VNRPAADLRAYETDPGLLIRDPGGGSVNEARDLIELIEDHPDGCGMCGGPRTDDKTARWPRPRILDRLDEGPTAGAER